MPTGARHKGSRANWTRCWLKSATCRDTDTASAVEDARVRIAASARQPKRPAFATCMRKMRSRRARNRGRPAINVRQHGAGSRAASGPRPGRWVKPCRRAFSEGLTPVIDMVQEPRPASRLHWALHWVMTSMFRSTLRHPHSLARAGGFGDLAGPWPRACNLLPRFCRPWRVMRRLSQTGLVARDEGTRSRRCSCPGSASSVARATCGAGRFHGHGRGTDALGRQAETAQPACRRDRHDRVGRGAPGRSSGDTHTTARTAREACEAEERNSRTAWRDADGLAASARTSLAEAEKKHAQTAARLQSLHERRDSLCRGPKRGRGT
jgi:hypothetical protein